MEGMDNYKEDNNRKVTFLKEMLSTGDKWAVFSNRQLVGPFEKFITFPSAEQAASYCRAINGGPQERKSGKEIKCQFDMIDDLVAHFSLLGKDYRPVTYDKTLIAETLDTHQVLPYLEETPTMQAEMLASGLTILGRISRVIMPLDWIEAYQLILHQYEYHYTKDMTSHVTQLWKVLSSQEEAVAALNKKPTFPAHDPHKNMFELLMIAKYKGGNLNWTVEGRPTPDTGLLAGVYNYNMNKVYLWPHQLERPVTFQQTVFLRIDPSTRRLSILDDHLKPMDFDSTVKSVSADYMKSNIYKAAERFINIEVVRMPGQPSRRPRKRRGSPDDPHPGQQIR